jgi:hypothetical protein
MPQVHLVGGECDGYRQATTWLDRPDIFYVPSLADLEEIKSIKDHVAKATRFKERSLLAYEFLQATIGETEIEFRYTRCQSRDRDQTSKTDPASPVVE